MKYPLRSMDCRECSRRGDDSDRGDDKSRVYERSVEYWEEVGDDDESESIEGEEGKKNVGV